MLAEEDEGWAEVYAQADHVMHKFKELEIM
jgi:hypothetical protein